jgi:7-cyano-7-deazaguanine reductase
MDTPKLETFPNPHPGREYVIKHVQPEFTSVCPVTGHPDFGTITMEYVAGDLCVELKSLKQYYQSYRNEGVFYEDLINRFVDDFVAALNPKWLEISGKFTPRGGMHSEITATHVRDDMIEESGCDH